jgi:hypothetical protein
VVLCNQIKCKWVFAKTKKEDEVGHWKPQKTKWDLKKIIGSGRE